MTKYFYDTYAIIEFIRGNSNFKQFFLDDEGVTTLYNVMEVYYILLREEGEKVAKEALELIKPLMIHPDADLVEESMKFRLKYRKKKVMLSYADCLGYFLAKKEDRKFLTGDDSFKDLQNVKFVK